MTIAHDSDKEFISAFRRGDSDAVEFLFSEYYKLLVIYAKLLLKWTTGDAEDIVVDAFVKLMKNTKAFETLAGIKAFLYVTTRNNCYDYHRHLKVRHRHEKETLYLLQQDAEIMAGNDINFTHAELLNAIFEEVEKLPEQRKEIFKLRFQEQLSISEIAVKLGTTEANVRNQHSKALKSLRIAFGKKDFLPVIVNSILLIIDSSRF